jgi:hypothetical protein
MTSASNDSNDRSFLLEKSHNTTKPALTKTANGVVRLNNARYGTLAGLTKAAAVHNSSHMAVHRLMKKTAMLKSQLTIWGLSFATGFMYYHLSPPSSEYPSLL